MLQMLSCLTTKKKRIQLNKDKKLTNIVSKFTISDKLQKQLKAVLAELTPK